MWLRCRISGHLTEFVLQPPGLLQKDMSMFNLHQDLRIIATTGTESVPARKGAKKRHGRFLAEVQRQQMI